MVIGGYTGKILIIDLSHSLYQIDIIDEATLRKYLGGSSLAVKLLAEMKWENDPFDSAIDMVITTGPITGTSAPCSGRYVVATKSPLTGTWGEAHASGFWGPELKYAGFDVIYIKGKAEKPTYLWINDGKVEFKDATHLLGRDTFETEEMLREELGDTKIRVLCIGPAGEKLSRIAAIMNDHGRTAARGGLGAVMGSKNLKAIAVRGYGKLTLAQTDNFNELRKSLFRLIAGSPAGISLKTHGTDGGMEAFYSMGDVPIKNWSQGVWEEGIKKISGQAMTDTILVGRSTCWACPIGCGRIVEVKEGEYAGLKGKGPEYETAAAFGALCLNDNLPSIAKLNDLCNRLGLDTISTGSIVAMVIECYENGLLSSQDLDGLELSWGNHRSMVKLVEKIGRREGIGDLLAEGSLIAAKHFGKGAEEIAIQVKGLELPMHDPRAFSSIGLSYITVARGGCHIAAPTYWLERGFTFPDLGFPEPLDRFSSENKAKWVKVFQDFCEVIESMVICKFAVYSGLRSHDVVKLITYATGWDIDLEEILKIGERSINLKRLINLRLGFSRKDDILPKRLTVLPLKEGGTDGFIPDVDSLLQEYYFLRHWDVHGVPTKDKLDELGLLSEISEKYSALLI